ncbi:NnrS family protein [Pseudomonas sp. RIT-PI-AD]|uniref:NnrS family protein n=1 Tax=Pseudomonas sp. RIT-PI-AD TaxID=3035294 RepID=UPI0021DAB73E|nr:NnrS family protein [Pseudomonas sp. RIT-PI-AD]
MQPAPLWRLGFRPFFLAGAAFAALAVLGWLLALRGWLGDWQPVGGWLTWHRHEMPFGFGMAIIAGFLLTAVQNWTGQPGLRGRPLMALAALWLAARLAWALGAPLALVLPLECAFLPALAWALGRSLWKARQRNNYPVLALVMLLAACDGLFLAGLVCEDPGWQRRSAFAALWLVAALMSLIGGRVVPFFTQRGLGEQAPSPSWPWLERSILALSLGAALTQVFAFGLRPQAGLALLYGALGVAQALRLLRWYRPGIWRVPLLWSLHLAFFWLVLAAFGAALWHAGLIVDGSLPLHALSVGGMGGLILAMLARVSLGHTGRPLRPHPAMAWAFAALNLAALARVFLLPFWPQPALWLAGTLWMLGFALFVRHYGRLLCTPRADGQPG